MPLVWVVQIFGTLVIPGTNRSETEMAPPPLWDHMDELEKIMVRQWKQWPTRRLVVKKDPEQENEFLAVAFLNDLSHRDSCNVEFIFVRPDSRRLGHASFLLSHIIKWDRATLFAYPDSDESRAFFKKFNFVPVGDNRLAPADWEDSPFMNEMWARSKTQ